MNPVVVGQLLVPEYTFISAFFSYVISFAGSLLALWCAQRMVRANGSIDFAMLGCAAVALGGIGIWAMHFLAMSAYRLPITINYDVPLTLVSLVAAVLISGIALHLASGQRLGRRGGWAAGSLIAGVGVCVMHYMGMYAMNMRATMNFDPGRVAVSLVIAVAAAAAALWLAFNLKRFSHQAVAALVMAVAVSSMHYVGMGAADMVCIARAPSSAWVVGGGTLPLAVFGFAGAVLLSIAFVLTGRDLGGAAPRRA